MQKRDHWLPWLVTSWIWKETPSKKTEEIKFGNNGRIFQGILWNFVAFTFWLFWRREWWPMINNFNYWRPNFDYYITDLILNPSEWKIKKLVVFIFVSLSFCSLLYVFVCHFFFLWWWGEDAFLLFIYWLIHLFIYQKCLCI